MFNKIVDVLKEVFWLKKSTTRKKAKTTKKALPKKRAVKKAVKAKVVKTPSKSIKPIKTVKKSVVIEKSAKPVKPIKTPKIKLPVIDPNLVCVGEITHYFERIKVAVLKVTDGSVIIGDKIHIIGVKTKITQKVWSMQVDRVDVKVAKKGQDIGLKIDKPVEVGDKVYINRK